MGIRRIDDPQNPRGYREIRSNAEMRKLMDRKSWRKVAFARSAENSSTITPISCPTISTLGAWEERGGTIIPTTSRPFTGGVTEKRVPAGPDDADQAIRRDRRFCEVLTSNARRHDLALQIPVIERLVPDPMIEEIVDAVLRP